MRKSTRSTTLRLSVLASIAILFSNSTTAQTIKRIAQNKVKEAAVATAQQGTTLYANPVGLSYVGTISPNDHAVCNLLTRHKAINGGAWLWASLDKAVWYKDMTPGNTTSWKWTVPGYDKVITTKDAQVTYSEPGVYNFPTLETTGPDGTGSYSADLSIKVGGRAEITTVDMREYNKTYQWGHYEYSGGLVSGGYVGGTNSRGVVGFGNLFMFGTDDCVMEGVNIYLTHKPTKYKEGAKINLQVWYPEITQNSITLTKYKIEDVPMLLKDIKADGEDGAWAITNGGAVASFTFETPIDMYGKTLLFISVEGFSDDPTTEDFCMLEDLIGKKLTEKEMTNPLCHSSFGRLNGETDYLRPISYYGGGTGSFAICPVMRIGEVTGIKNVSAEKAATFSARMANNKLEITSAKADIISLYNVAGALLKQIKIASGTSTIDMDNCAGGIYILRNAGGQSQKILKQ